MKFNAFSSSVFFSLVLIGLCFGCASKRIEPAAIEAKSPPVVQTSESATKLKQLREAVLTLNGKEVQGWQVTGFGGAGEVSAQNGEIQINMGAELSGFHWTNAALLPKTNYEIDLNAMKVEGGDFFCGLTVPVSNSFCTLVVGGWGGGIVGISSINGADASENDSTRSLYFPRNRWYHIRLQVRPDKIVAWIDQEKVVDVELEGRKISMRGGEIESSVPLGIATYQTSAVIKNIRLKSL